ncbi:MAG: FG-GAP repeat protein, partial [Planctomycetota bacterium]
MTADIGAASREPFTGPCVQLAIRRRGRGLVERSRIQGPPPKREYEDSAAMLKTSTTVLWMGAAWGLALLGATQATADPCHESGKCTASDSAVGDRFGQAVAIDSNVAVMGAPHDDDLAGSAYIFEHDGAGWGESPTKVTAADADADDEFGFAVSVSADVLLVGAPQDEDAGPWYGSAYVFRLNGASWEQEQKLFAPELIPLGFFGTSVAVDGNVAVVGAHNADGTGAAYVFRFNSLEWVFEDRLAAS